MVNMMTEHEDRQWTAITVPKSGEFQTLLQRLEKQLRAEMGLPRDHRLPPHVIVTIAMKRALESR